MTLEDFEGKDTAADAALGGSLIPSLSRSRSTTMTQRADRGGGKFGPPPGN